MVPQGRLELPRLATSASKTDVSTIPPPGHNYYLFGVLYGFSPLYYYESFISLLYRLAVKLYCLGLRSVSLTTLNVTSISVSLITTSPNRCAESSYNHPLRKNINWRPVPDLNRWPHAWQACALTNWANEPLTLVVMIGLEPMIFSVWRNCISHYATSPYRNTLVS